MKILSLNCQKAYRPELAGFLRRALSDETYDCLLLQEATDAVLPLLAHPSYALVARNGLAVAYRSSFRLLKTEFEQFDGFPFGILLLRLSMEGREAAVGSIHAHSGLRPSVRRADAARMKAIVLRSSQRCALTVFGGDFNLGFPGEVSRIEGILSPEFASATKSVGPTLDSRFVEENPALTNRAARLLASFGVNLSFRVDHVFIDAQTAGDSVVSARALPDRVSDHRPVEVTLS
jgi:endonuclease/exonuclease/phosphatase family metal-dependent hydrolase